MPPSPSHRRNAALSVRRFAEATNLSLVIIDKLGFIEFVNQSTCDVFGYSRSEMIGQPITIIVPERMRSAHMSGLARVANGAKPNLGGRTVEVSAIRKDGSEFPIEITLSVWEGRNGISAGAVIKDISERREREAKLLRLASQDTLTGLYNRHQFTNLLTESLGSDTQPSILLLDLDGFKEVNDTHGHAVGDTLLQAVGVRLLHIAAPGWTLARFGGDEFAILLGKSGTRPDVEAERVLEAFGKPFHLSGLAIDLSLSIGIATAPDHGREAEELIASADFALYRAKANGGQCHRTFDQAMRTEAHAVRTTRDELRHALREGQLVLHYQPQVRLQSGEIIGFEALIRWKHPIHGLVLPGFFLPALEQSLLALDIGWWTLDEACRVASEISRSGEAYKISVNLFPIQFRALNLFDKVAEAIAKHGLKPEQLELEVTEEIALGDDRSARTLARLRDMGVGIAFDDFGTGYASLRSLQRYPLTTLKIDKGFIHDLKESPQDTAITRALISMSKDLKLETIAEGIETAAQAAALIAMGCACGQGFLYGRAIPEDEIAALLLKDLKAIAG